MFFSGKPPVIYAVLADLPNYLTVSDFSPVTSLNSLNNGIPGVAGTVSCVSGCGDVSAVPLPAAFPLFASALAGLGGVGWWKRRGKVSRKSS